MSSLYDKGRVWDSPKLSGERCTSRAASLSPPRQKKRNTVPYARPYEGLRYCTVPTDSTSSLLFAVFRICDILARILLFSSVTFKKKKKKFCCLLLLEGTIILHLLDDGRIWIRIRIRTSKWSRSGSGALVIWVQMIYFWIGSGVKIIPSKKL